jgi:hypothetical protein
MVEGFVISLHICAHCSKDQSDESTLNRRKPRTKRNWRLPASDSDLTTQIFEVLNRFLAQETYCQSGGFSVLIRAIYILG